MRGVGFAGVLVGGAVGFKGLGGGGRRRGRVPVGEDDDFVDAEDGEGARYVACHGGFEVVGLCAGGC